jgi:hypothetical protein
VSHPKELIDDIVSAIKDDYPPRDYRITTEKALPGTRYFPDVAVFDRADRVVAVIEIGYTRPEKLTAYREMGIADIRWYDKGGNNHGVTRTVHYLAEVQPSGVVEVYRFDELIGCHDAEDCAAELAFLDRLLERYERRFGSTGPKDLKRFYRRWEAALEDNVAGVETLVATDGAVIASASFCDKCGSTWISNPEEAEEIAVLIGADILDAGRAFKRDHRVQSGSWQAAVSLIEGHFGQRLDYRRDSTPIDPDAPSVSAVVRAHFSPGPPPGATDAPDGAAHGRTSTDGKE